MVPAVLQSIYAPLNAQCVSGFLFTRGVSSEQGLVIWAWGLKEGLCGIVTVEGVIHLGCNSEQYANGSKASGGGVGLVVCVGGLVRTIELEFRNSWFQFSQALFCDLRGSAEVALFGIWGQRKVRPPRRRGGRKKGSGKNKSNLSFLIPALNFSRPSFATSAAPRRSQKRAWKNSRQELRNSNCFYFFQTPSCDLRGAGEVALFVAPKFRKVRPPRSRGGRKIGPGKIETRNYETQVRWF